jgi:ATP-dependent protease ClpP protease subunit
MSGVDVEARRLRKGAADAIKAFVEAEGGTWPAMVGETVDKIARDTERDNFMGGDAAVAYGLIDRVMERRGEALAIAAK